MKNAISDIVSVEKMYSYVRNIGEKLQELGIKEGDRLYISSDISRIIVTAQRDLGFRDKYQGFIFLRLLVEELENIITDKGTILFPMYNWDFCEGIPFDYHNTKSKVGALNNFVHENFLEFKRTKHPLYSLIVWGSDADYLCNLDNQEAFGWTSPFGFLDRNGGKQLALGVPVWRGITYCHYLEQLVGVPYRYHKFFLGKYIDEDGNSEFRSYSMFVRRLDVSYKPVTSDDFYVKHGLITQKIINGWSVSVLKFASIRDTVIDNLRHSADCMYEFENYDIKRHEYGENKQYEVGKLIGYELI